MATPKGKWTGHVPQAGIAPIYDVDDIENVLMNQCALVSFTASSKRYEGERIRYLNCPAAFDIETTSTEIGGEKISFMYQWQFGINGAVFMGRTWEEFVELIERISQFYYASATKRIVIFIENEAFEFQFMRKYFDWEYVFSLDERRPVAALTTLGIEFRCSYILSGYSLEKIGENLMTYKCNKLVGQYDYNKIRHCDTPLTQTELNYCEMDVRVVMAYIQEKIEEDGSIANILLTKTSYVRQYVRRYTLYNKDPLISKDYKKLIKKLTLEPDEYLLAHEAFTGGFTHGNPYYIDVTLKTGNTINNKVIKSIHSIDFTSSYPSSLIAFKYPMGKGTKREITSKKEFLKYYNSSAFVSIFKIRLINLTEKENVPDNILSLSKCFIDEDHKVKMSHHDAITNNGRIVMAYRDVYTTITSVDFESLTKFYDFDYEVTTMWIYKADYLPKPFIECILHFYKLKTELKDIPGKEAEYQWAKGMLNALYGMCVTDICRDDIVYDDLQQWSHQKHDFSGISNLIYDYNTSKSRFLSYIWGVFCTAYSRANLYSGLLEFNEDYIYSDTDSIKCINIEDHMTYFNNYNFWIVNCLENTLKHYNIDPAEISPLDKNGKSHPLGVWDWETQKDPYLKFKSLGAKRYLTYQKKKGHSLTVAGLPKSTGELDANDHIIKTVKKLVDRYGEDGIFDAFKNDMVVTPDETNKLLLTYVDGPCEGYITDYLGHVGHYSERSYVHMAKIGFEFSRDKAFIDYLLGIKTERSYD